MHIGFRSRGRGYSQVITLKLLIDLILLLLLNSLLVIYIYIYIFFYFCIDGTGEVNWKGVAYYNRLINYMIDQGNYFILNLE